MCLCAVSCVLRDKGQMPALVVDIVGRWKAGGDVWRAMAALTAVLKLRRLLIQVDGTQVP